MIQRHQRQSFSTKFVAYSALLLTHGLAQYCLIIIIIIIIIILLLLLCLDFFLCRISV